MLRLGILTMKEYDPEDKKNQKRPIRKPRVCTVCKGTGMVPVLKKGDKNIWVHEECPICEAMGYIDD